MTAATGRQETGRHGPSQRRALLGEAARALGAAGVEASWVEAQLLLAHALHVDWGRVLLGDDVDPEAEARFRGLLQRRVGREPLQHITGAAPFRWIELSVGPGVFVPRPETELLLDLVAADLTPGRTVVDLCSGSGAVALAVAHEHPSTHVVAVERASEALVWLRRNVERQIAAGDNPIEVVAADVAGWRPAALAGRVDVVLANPPYLPVAGDVAVEVRADPAEAVFAGADGLALMPALAATAAWLLRDGSVFAVEHDETHAAAVREILGAAGFTGVVTERDLAGRDRFATGRRAGRRAGGQDEASWA